MQQSVCEHKHINSIGCLGGDSVDMKHQKKNIWKVANKHKTAQHPS